MYSFFFQNYPEINTITRAQLAQYKLRNLAKKAYTSLHQYNQGTDCTAPWACELVQKERETLKNLTNTQCTFIEGLVKYFANSN